MRIAKETTLLIKVKSNNNDSWLTAVSFAKGLSKKISSLIAIDE